MSDQYPPQFGWSSADQPQHPSPRDDGFGPAAPSGYPQPTAASGPAPGWGQHPTGHPQNWNQPPNPPAQPQPWGQPQPQAQPEPWGQPTYLTPTPPARKSRKGVIIGSSVGVALLLASGTGVFAYQALSGGGDQPSVAVPSSAIAYLSVDLDPSASQKVNLLRLMKRVPQLSEQGIDENADPREQLFDQFLKSTGCQVDYATDVEPWIGQRAAIALLENSESPIIALQVSDTDKAKAGMSSLLACAGEGGTATVDDYLIIAEDEATASAAAEQAKTSPLSQDEQFTADLKSLGDTGLATFWMDVPAITAAYGQTAALSTPGVDPSAGVDTLYGSLRAGSDHLELAFQAHVNDGYQDNSTGTDLTALPETTTAALATRPSPARIETTWNSASEMMGVADSQDLTQQTGLDMPADLVTLLSGGTVFAMDASNFDATSVSNGDLGAIDVGMRCYGDSQAQNAVLDKVEALLTEGGEVDLARTTTPDGVVIASNDRYASSLGAGGSLGSKDAFTRAVPNAEDAVASAYIDLNSLSGMLQQIDDIAPSAETQEAIRALEPLSSVGVAVYAVQDERVAGQIRLTFD